MVKGEFMRIGIDIDGVLTDVIRYACDYGSKYFFEKYGKLEINNNSCLLYTSDAADDSTEV